MLHKLTVKQVTDKFSYDPETGILTSRVKYGSKPEGRVVGCTDERGYVRVRVGGMLIKAHRVIWFMQTGDVPPIIDHINRDKGDNRWCNLRIATSSENAGNASISPRNTSGFKGVSFDKSRNRWRASVPGSPAKLTVESKYHAAVVYNYFAEKHFGKFANLNYIPGLGVLSVPPDSIELYL